MYPDLIFERLWTLLYIPVCAFLSLECLCSSQLMNLNLYFNTFSSRKPPRVNPRQCIHHPRRYVSNFLVRMASSLGAPGMWGTPSKQSRGIDPPVSNRRGEGAQMKWCGNLGVPVEWDRRVREHLVSHQGCKVPFRTLRRNVVLFLRRHSRQGPHLGSGGFFTVWATREVWSVLY